MGGSASGITLTGNKAYDNLDDGFHIQGDSCTLDDNVSKFNLNYGFWINSTAVATSGSGNVGKKNRTDFCENGTNPTVTGTFGTTCP